ncbi:MAG: adenylate/guanylate cyclase domain-containing protein [Saprospiraceae bacterium]
MTRINLKNIILKNHQINAVILGLISQLNGAISIEDHEGNILLGKSKGVLNNPELSLPLLSEGVAVGYVHGVGADIIAHLVTFLIQKEAEKKKLGSEVLNLYQELNVIYNFSEQLTQTIEPDVIAQITLDQAVHSIPSEGGVIVLWDESTKQLNVPAASGLHYFDTAAIKEHTDLLFKIGLSGQSEILGDISALKTSGMLAEDVKSIVYAAMKVKHRIMGAIILAGEKEDQYSAAHLKLLVTLALQSSTAIESAMLFEKNIREVREREEAILCIHEVTKKFVPHEFIRALGKESLLDVQLGDQVGKTVTVLFTDIRDFTSLSERMTPEENFRFVSSFNERLGPIIRSHRGFINQYLGDSIMALFPEEPEDALKAAISMQQAIDDFNKDRIAIGLEPIKAGIGLHTGPLIMGITGDEYRLDAATISDTVNTASRIESLTKYFRSPLLLSGDTLQLIQNPLRYNVRHLGKAQLKGKNNLISIVECIDGYSIKERDLKMKSLNIFKDAMKQYLDKNFAEAITCFEAILELDSNDFTAKNFINKSIEYQINGIAENWTGAMEIAIK